MLQTAHNCALRKLASRRSQPRRSRVRMPFFERRRAFHEREPSCQMGISSHAKHGVGARSPDCANDENCTAAARRLRLRFSKRPRKPNSDPADPVVVSAARLDAMDALVDDWLSENSEFAKRMAVSACWPCGGSFSRQGEARRSGPPQSKDGRHQRRSISCACGFTRKLTSGRK
jgi:hypothetical protein